MANSSCYAAAIAALLFGCTSTQPPDQSEDPTLGSGSGFHDPLPPRPVHPSPSCIEGVPSGSLLASFDITGGDQVAVDAAGNIFYTADTGIVKLAADGANVFTYGFGSTLALDAAGNAYVAGAFTQTTDFGGGFVLAPQGNIDVFVVKLSPRGVPLAAFALGLCGDGVQSIAVARDGRIAVSGSAMGTAVLDATGKLDFQLAYFGSVAFDSTGDLFVGGSFTGSLELDSAHVLSAGNATDMDGFVAKVDRDGNLARSVQLGDAPLPVNNPGFGVVTTPQRQQIQSIAIDSNDQLAISGQFFQEMSLFGDTLTNPPDVFEAGEVDGGFAARLDDSLAVTQAHPLFDLTEMDAVAIDGGGNVIVSAGVVGHIGNGTYPFVTDFAAPGFTIGGNIFSGDARGVAADACGNVYWADDELQPGNLFTVQQRLRVFAH
ncbi:MAG TPA: hypothetical protein VGF94_16320 [Kofleriaceae bacterium]|jgi:hypothetical protein